MSHNEKTMQFGSSKLILLVILIFLSGCKDSPTISPPSSSGVPITSMSTSIVIPSSNPSVTYTPSSKATATYQPAATIALTPLPIIPKDKVRAKFDQLYAYNNGCSLPCWWGITPGITTWREALHFLHQFDQVSRMEEDQKYPLTENPSEFTHVILRFPGPFPDVGFTRVDFEVQNGIVVAIRLAQDIGGWMFPLKKLYAEYGQPDRVFIAPESCQENLNSCDANLYLVYDEKRFLSINGMFGAINDKTVNLCVIADGAISTWAPKVKIDLNPLKSPDSTLIPLQGKILSENPITNELETCFDVPIDLWK